MLKAAELLRQGRSEELWQMCCGHLNLSLKQFMVIQKRLLREQIGLLQQSPLGSKLMRGANPQTLDEFRQQVLLTEYPDYCPELADKIEDSLPAKPLLWVHTSGHSADYSCKWIPMSERFAEELSIIQYGVGMVSGSRRWGDRSGSTDCPRIVYTVAPPPYMSGTMASLLERQSPARFLPPLDMAEDMPFDERIKLGFQMALSEGFDYFFGLSLVLVAVGNRFGAGGTSIRSLPREPRALFRLSRGLVKSRFAGRKMLPRDVWSIKGIMSGGLDSSVYKDRIKYLWGRHPLDVYASSEAGIVATQTWDYEGMTFVPSLNFLEFIPEKECLDLRVNRNPPGTLLLDEVEGNGVYEVVITNFHGGALVRYRTGDMVRIISLRNEKSGIRIPQMVFERRAGELLDFVVVRLSEKSIWRSLEKAGVAYEDWTAYKIPGETVLHLLLETRPGYGETETRIAERVRAQMLQGDEDSYTKSAAHDDLAGMIDFQVEVTLLPRGAFANFTARRQAEGADPAHLKPPHINPTNEVLAILRQAPVIELKEEVMVGEYPPVPTLNVPEGTDEFKFGESFPDNRSGIPGAPSQPREIRLSAAAKTAGLPQIKTLDTFDFSFQPSIDRSRILRLHGLEFIERKENVVFTGLPGVGKTHLAISLAVTALEKGKKVRFDTLAGMVASLEAADREGKLEEKLEFYANPDLLVIDEAGYTPLNPVRAGLIFRVVSVRYERASIVLTAGKKMDRWVDIFSDPDITAAIADRLFHHCHAIDISGNSYRMRHKPG